MWSRVVPESVIIKPMGISTMPSEIMIGEAARMNAISPSHTRFRIRHPHHGTSTKTSRSQRRHRAVGRSMLRS